MNGFRLVLPAVVLILAGGACSVGSPVKPTPIPTAPSATTDGEPEGPTINWDHPFLSEGQHNVDATAVSTAPESFGLSIRPITPIPTGATLRWTDVSAAGTVAYMFDFSGTDTFAADARVDIEESPSDMTQDEYINGGAWVGTDNTVTPVGPLMVLVRAYNGIAAASFVAGGTLYEVKGPQLAPAPALDIATQLAKQIAPARPSN